METVTLPRTAESYYIKLHNVACQTSYLTLDRSGQLQTSRSQQKMSSISDLRKLSNIISSAVDRIEGICNARGLDFPSPDAPFTRESETIREIPEVYNATNLIASAAGHLAAIARSPAMTMIDVSFKVHL